MRDLMDFTKGEFDRYGIKEDHYINAMRSCIKAESGLRSFRIRFIVSVAPAAVGLLLMMFNPFSDEVFNTTILLFAASLAINVGMHRIPTQAREELREVLGCLRGCDVPLRNQGEGI